LGKKKKKKDRPKLTLCWRGTLGELFATSAAKTGGGVPRIRGETRYVGSKGKPRWFTAGNKEVWSKDPQRSFRTG